MKPEPEPVPDTADQAFELADMGALARSRVITVLRNSNDRYDLIAGHQLIDKPPGPEPEACLPEYAPIGNDEVPF